MKKLFNLAIYYAVLGLSVGVYYREVTKLNHYEGPTMLKSVHPHLLVLGLVMTLVLILLMNQYQVKLQGKMKTGFILYHVGVHIAVAMMLLHGTMDVLLMERQAAISGIAGMGHLILAIGLLMMLFQIKKHVKE